MPRISPCELKRKLINALRSPLPPTRDRALNSAPPVATGFSSAAAPHGQPSGRASSAELFLRPQTTNHAPVTHDSPHRISQELRQIVSVITTVSLLTHSAEDGKFVLPAGQTAVWFVRISRGHGDRAPLEVRLAVAGQLTSAR